jgi:uncharacterized DUF497 family protein
VFDWDEENIRHIARHDVTPEEAEQVLGNDPTFVEEQEAGNETRELYAGTTDALRCLEVVTTWRGDLLRVVTAYPASPSMVTYHFRRRR